MREPPTYTVASLIWPKTPHTAPATIRLSLAADGAAIGLLVGVFLPVRAANRRCVTCDQAASASLSLSSK
jgi:hypothetical protein